MCTYNEHKKFMSYALELAKKGEVSPNPMVGCVIVKNNKIIAQGYHQKYGEAHAEINAFNSLDKNIDLKNTTLYVTLEPCSHFCKTPPCVNRIIEEKISRVVIATIDPNPLVSGNGIKKLNEMGIETIVGVLENEARKLNEIFFKFIKDRKPFVLLKSAMTLDGKIATKTGESKWISSEESRQEVHEIRAKFTAIMIGVNTVIKDNPMLNSRIENGDESKKRNPIRIILDSKLKTPQDSNIVNTANEIKTIIATIENNDEKYKPFLDKNIEILECKSKNNKVDLKDLMTKLAEKNIDSILLEGGSTLAYEALKENIVDKVRIYISPKIFGGEKYSVVSGDGIDNIDDAFNIIDYEVTTNKEDIIIEGYIKNKLI